MSKRNRDVQEHDSAHKVSYYTFEYTIPRIHKYSREEFRHKGFAGHYDKQQLRLLMEERMLLSGTLIEIARHHAEDHDPQLVDPSKSVEMYEIICEHLENASYVIARNSNLGDVPINDLRALADLSRDLFTVASQFAPKLGEDKRLSRFRQLAGRGLKMQTGIRGSKRKKDEELGTRLRHNPVIGAIEDFIELNERDKRRREEANNE